MSARRAADIECRLHPGFKAVLVANGSYQGFHVAVPFAVVKKESTKCPRLH
jgi:hypothetical protein